ncbi:MAG: hypothetical protein KatS3mg105_3876 [Gemmatales bacterium]|nr:MAG: hypothetical protein KatS3mg105_3876 [Gemmatales bacterium]
MKTQKVTRRTALKGMVAASFSAPFVFRKHVGAAPSQTLRHVSFGGNGMAWADIRSLTSNKNVRLVAVVEVDLNRLDKVKKEFPDVKVYQDYRELFDKEKNLDTANISTPDHMHAPITMRAMQAGLHVYTQKPLTQTIYEARQLARVAAEKKLVTQMGIQIHSHPVHRTVVATIQAGRHRQGKRSAQLERQTVGRQQTSTRSKRPGSPESRLGLVARRCCRTAIHRRLLSSQCLA